MTDQSLSSVVQKLHEYVQEGPTEFEITILPTVATDKMETDELSLRESLVLMEGQFLGMDARSLPWMTRTIRRDYKALKNRTMTMDAYSSSADSSASATTVVTSDGINDALHLQILMITNALMLVNPDHSTAWGDRRRALLATAGDWDQEMKFLNLMMTQHSKAPSSWGHRKYVLRQIIKAIVAEEGESISKLVDLVRKEIAHCSKIAERFPKNYYSWTHRRYLWSSCILPHLGNASSSNETTKMLLRQEFEALKRWLEQHISDHSAVHYLGQVLQLWLQQSDEKESLAIAQKSLDLSATLLETHPDHESLWILRRLMIRTLFQHGQSNLTEIGRKAIYSLLESLIDDVHGKVVSKSEYAAPAISVHVWSFLVWCLSQLYLGGQDRSKRIIQQGLEVLKSHDHVYHRMWQTHGEEVLLVD